MAAAAAASCANNGVSGGSVSEKAAGKIQKTQDLTSSQSFVKNDFSWCASGDVGLVVGAGLDPAGEPEAVVPAAGLGAWVDVAPAGEPEAVIPADGLGAAVVPADGLGAGASGCVAVAFVCAELAGE